MGNLDRAIQQADRVAHECGMGLVGPETSNLVAEFSRLEQFCRGYDLPEDGPTLADLVAMLDQTRGALNSTRLIMTDQKTRDMAGEMVQEAYAILAAFKPVAEETSE